MRPMENAASRSNRRETAGKGREERLAIASPDASLDNRNFSALQPLSQFSLMSRSKKIHDLITNKESHEAARRDTGGEPEEDVGEIREKEMEMVLEEDEEADVHRIRLLEFPGRAEAFELAAKFCYCIKLGLTPATTTPLRCTAERTSFSAAAAAATAAYTVSNHFAMVDGRIRQ